MLAFWGPLALAIIPYVLVTYALRQLGCGYPAIAAMSIIYWSVVVVLVAI